MHHQPERFGISIIPPILVIFLIALVLPALAQDQEFQDFQELDLESMLDVEIEGATKTSLKLSEAPSTVRIITADEIRRSGAVNLPEVLELVPGVMVMTVSPSQYEVVIRGNCYEGCAKIKTMINGVAFVLGFFGTTRWDLLPLSMDDIDHLEVILGPMSVVYGANAFNGAINIVTKNPEKTAELMAGVMAGSKDLATNAGSLRYADSSAPISGSLTASWRNWGQWDPPKEKSDLLPENKAAKNWLTNGEFDYRFSDDSNLRLSGAFADAFGDQYTGLGVLGMHAIYTYGLVDLTVAGLNVRSQFNHVEAGVFPSTIPLDASNLLEYDPMAGPQTGVAVPPKIIEAYGINNWYDSEIRYTLDVVEDDRLTAGFNHLYNTVSFDTFFDNTDYSESIYAGFLYNELRVENFLLHVGARYDVHPVFGDMISPRAALIVQAAEGYSFRFSVGRAFRNPSLMETYLDAEVPTVLAIAPGGTSLDPPQYMVSPISGRAYGSEISSKVTGHKSDLGPEELTSAELSGDLYFTKRLSSRISVYYNWYRNSIDWLTNEEGTGMTWINLGTARQIGGEASLDYYPLPWLRFFANYAYRRLHFNNNNPESLQDERGVSYNLPQHTANLGVYSNFVEAFFADAYLHYESERITYLDHDFIPTYVTELDPFAVGNPITGGNVLTSPDLKGRQSAFVTLNARLAYRIMTDPDTEIFVAGRNINNWRNKTLPVPPVDAVSARYTGGVNVKFGL